MIKNRIFTEQIIQIKLWKAIIITILIIIGVIFLTTYLINFIEQLTLNRVHSGITHGIKSQQGKFWISKTIYIIPDGKNTGKIKITEPKNIQIAGAGDEGIKKVWEGK